MKGLRGIIGRSHLTRARHAARSGQWAAATYRYEKYLSSHPDDAAAWVQLGHGLKEQGRHQESVSAYRRAVSLVPGKSENRIFLAHALYATNCAGDAIETLLAGLADDPSASRLIDEIVKLGARDHLPQSVQQAIEQREGSYSLSRYGRYCERRNSGSRYINWCGFENIIPIIDGRGTPPDVLSLSRVMLGAVLGQVVNDDGIPAEGVLSPHRKIRDLPSSVTHLLLMDGGCRIEADLVDRLYSAIKGTGASAAYCDHDSWRSAEKDIVRSDPCFEPMYDRFWFDARDSWPPCMMIERQAIDPAMNWADLLDTRMCLPIRYAHVPLILASRWRGGSRTRSTPAHRLATEQAAIQVIIQTRDAPDMLARCIESLVAKATAPDRLDIIVMDNRSVLPETAALLSDWASRGVARIVTHDEPFNWARANNRAAALGTAPYLMFLNNDVEIESAGWDASLDRYLAMRDVGALGAMLFYPDGLIQHAGVIVGMGDGSPVHEGVGQRGDAAGPSHRWMRTRIASAVTGAWLATSRETFEAVGGFDESFPLSFNDIDFCMRCRAVERLIVQSSDIRAIHYESATRGKTLSRAAAERERADWLRLKTRWPTAFDCDPAYNPHWLRIGVPFDGFGTPSDQVVANWVEASARPNPWSVTSSVSGERSGSYDR